MKEEVVGETDLELKAHAGHLVDEERHKDEVVLWYERNRCSLDHSKWQPYGRDVDTTDSGPWIGDHRETEQPVSIHEYELKVFDYNASTGKLLQQILQGADVLKLSFKTIVLPTETSETSRNLIAQTFHKLSRVLIFKIGGKPKLSIHDEEGKLHFTKPIQPCNLHVRSPAELGVIVIYENSTACTWEHSLPVPRVPHSSGWTFKSAKIVVRVSSL